ncbi:heterokaryon incompatibility protein-domain-containing protein [Cercophora newfieldiana]|uniref:Heterokaryon incompatibility protein-domain-containing protein n=1 Tax=Cercophora newfieldiana TaxID=92897 RepID=A0AA40CIZ1_9PEZI|nr:heterokaryon incompatibility protein-domain-containing protein [Cercophora newfieldiana]
MALETTWRPLRSPDVSFLAQERGTRRELSSGPFTLLSTAEPGVRCGGKLIDPQWVDATLIPSWKARCQEHHKECRGWPIFPGFSQQRPQWVIDVVQMNIVSTPPDARYTALSYVWGGVRQLVTNLANLDNHRRPGAFRPETWTAPDIPKTVRDAMRITEALGERYLWVDALCIVQDDAAFKHAELANMASIYAGSDLTIIAADGEDVSSGLCGIFGVSDARFSRQQVFDLGHGTSVVQRRKWAATPPDNAWKGRCWTFQEGVFSRRKLIFHDGRVSWECAAAVWHEDSNTLDDADDHVSLNKKLGARDVTILGLQSYSIQAMFSMPTPDIGSLTDVLDHFNNRRLTYPEDMCDALAGVARALAHQYPGGFLCGLPVGFFSLALLWEPGETGSRRFPFGTKGPPRLPSWSWIGWKGQHDLSVWKHANLVGEDSDKLKPGHFPNKLQADHSNNTIVIKPLVRWLVHHERGDAGVVIEHCDLIERKRMDGMQATSETLGLDDDSSTDRYRKEGDISGRVPCPYQRDQKTTRKCVHLHPAITNPSLEETLGRNPSFISCRTRRARLSLIFPGTKNRYQLEDKFMGIVGEMQVHLDSPTQQEDRLSISKFWMAGRMRVETVEIAEGSESSLKRDTTRNRDPWDETASAIVTREFVWVLWIEWQRNTAYRRGIGKVDKRSWEALMPEWMDLMLG